MKASFWRPSDEQRHAILLLEVAGLLHDLGKLSSGFIKREASDRPKDFFYHYELLTDPNVVFPPITKEISERINTLQKYAKDDKRGAPFKDCDLTQALCAHNLQDWNAQSYNLAEILLAQYANSSCIQGKNMKPAKLIHYLHGVAHYEKEDPKKTIDKKKQNQALYKQPHMNTYAASPFGLESHIPVDQPGDLTTSISRVPLNDIAKIHTDERREWLATMRELMAKGIADTQRPTNEVSLWDWGYTVASMTKTAAAWIFKNGWPEKLEDLPFRTLCIKLDILDRYMRSDKISDLLGVSKAIDDAFRRVQILLEETYALGNCFYHDETGAYYLFSDLYGNENKEMVALRQEIQSLFPPDLRPRVYLAEPMTAGQLDSNKALSSKLVAEPRQQSLYDEPVQAESNLYLFETGWTEGRPENAEICTVCGVWPVGYPRKGSQREKELELAAWATQEKALRRNVCRVCLDRRGRRAEDWVKKGLQGTIWTGEVADANDMLALFVGRLGLNDWLKGKHLSTIKVTDDITKTPSPARLYRIAETGRAFWRCVSDQITPEIVRKKSSRLELRPREKDLPDLGDFHAYELSVDGLALSVVWDEPNARFLTAENLDCFCRRWRKEKSTMEELIDRLQGHAFDLCESSSFQRPERKLREVHITSVTKLNIGGYQPTIPVLAEPSTCMILVPADRALDLARAVKGEYERQMGRVRDRLPLHIGLVFFCRRHTPISTVLEAGRAMLAMGNNRPEGWRLVNKSGASEPATCVLSFDNEIVWRMPIWLGDGKQPGTDKWYPRLNEGDSLENKQAKHVMDLQVREPDMPSEEGPKVWVWPSLFDFEYLDTTGRRFEIYYGQDGRRPRRTRPFYLEDLERLETLWNLIKLLKTSQRYKVIHAIENTRELWYGRDAAGQAEKDDVFQQFVTDTLAGAEWRKDKSWKNIEGLWQKKLIQAGVRGELADLAELHMGILKEKD